MVFKTAELTVQTVNECSYVQHICRDYLCQSPAPDLLVHLTKTDPLEQSIELLRAVNDALISKDTFLMHCSALSIDGCGYLFAAHSGTGKSTHARMWRQVFGDKVIMVNDDKPFIKITGNGALVYGSPWNGKHSLSTNICVPIKAICFLERGTQDKISPVNPDFALNHIFDQLPRSTDPAYTLRLLELVDKLLTNTPLYRLECTPTENAAKVAYTGITGGKI